MQYIWKGYQSKAQKLILVVICQNHPEDNSFVADKTLSLV